MIDILGWMNADGSGDAGLDQHFEKARIIAGAARLLANVEHFAIAREAGLQL